MDHLNKLEKPKAESIAAPILDPVCGMVVKPDSATGSFVYDNETYYFCSTHCLQKFRQEPARFTNKSAGLSIRRFLFSRGSCWRNWHFVPPGTHVQCILQSVPTNPVPVPRAEWHWSHSQFRRHKRKLNTPVQCIRRSSAMRQAVAQFVAWRSSHGRFQSSTKRTMNSRICGGGFG